MRAHELLHQFLVSDSDLDLIAEFGQHSDVRVSDLIDDFYQWLANQLWYQEYFSDGVPGRVKSLQQAYWEDFLTGHVNDAYIERRIRVGEIHAAINLPVSAYLAGMNFAQSWFFAKARHLYRRKQRCLDVHGAISRLIQMDSNIVMQVYAAKSMQTIREQGELTEAIVSEATRVASIAAKGNFNVRYERQAPEDGLEAPINQLIASLHQVTQQALEIAEGNYEIPITPADDDDELGKAMQQMVHSLQEVGQMAGAIAKGNYDIELKPRGAKDTLTKSLNQMVESLREFRRFSEREKWIKSGVAELAVALRNTQSIAGLAEETIQFVTQYVDAAVGLFYQIDSEQTATITAGYACPASVASRRVRPGEGLVGQVLKDKAPIRVSDVPAEYLPIASGLGSADAAQVLVFPVIVNNAVQGILELGTMGSFSDDHVDWLYQISESIGVAIRTAEDQATVQSLLETTQETSEELKLQQAELQSANLQLEKQALALKHSEEALKEQKSQLEQSNLELTNKTDVLEQQKADLEQAKLALQAKADQLSSTSRYKSEFLANMSHELRTPLNSLLLLSQSLMKNREGNLSESQLEDIGIIHRGGRSLLDLINDILDLSKVEAGKLRLEYTDVDVHQLVEEITAQFKPLADEKDLAFNVDVAMPETFRLHTDRQRLRQILNNLIGNAIKFTAEGSVTLTIAENTDGQLAFTVEDTGIGIEQAQHDSVFEAFAQVDGTTSRQHGGTGLGLTISRDLASLLGGSIHLTSEADEGSRFSLVLPQDSKPLAASAPATDLSRIDNPTLRPLPNDEYLLIIEDDPSFAAYLEKAARKQGMSALVTGYGLQALSYCLRKPPGAVILDLGLPDIDGCEILQVLQNLQHHRNIPVHVISALDDPARAMQLGAEEYLAKPINLEQLNQVFETISIGTRDTLSAAYAEADAFIRNLTTNGQPLPATSETPVSEPQPSLRSEPKVLVVDDDLRNTYTLSKILSNEGFRVSIADNGQLALDKLSKDSNIALILMDIMMPVMDGYETIARIRAQHSETLPIIALTAKAMPEDRQKCLSAGADDYLPKPVDLEQLLVKVRGWIDGTDASKRA
ncbi:response regulator [Reinekea blandensis]|nr:response regulator [Reinekea blandensis]